MREKGNGSFPLRNTNHLMSISITVPLDNHIWVLYQFYSPIGDHQLVFNRYFQGEALTGVGTTVCNPAPSISAPTRQTSWSSGHPTVDLMPTFTWETCWDLKNMPKCFNYKYMCCITALQKTPVTNCTLAQSGAFTHCHSMTSSFCKRNYVNKIIRSRAWGHKWGMDTKTAV